MVDGDDECSNPHCVWTISVSDMAPCCPRMAEMFDQRQGVDSVSRLADRIRRPERRKRRLSSLERIEMKGRTG
jgi:hypothetical protein